MNADLVTKIADAVLYEGYMLYPYRPSSLKNRQRWTFGGLYPPAYAARHSEALSLTSELLIESTAEPALDVRVRFLHLISRAHEGRLWQEAMEREVTVRVPQMAALKFPASMITDGRITRRQSRIDGIVETSLQRLRDGVFKVGLRVANTTEFTGTEDTTRDEASMEALVSAHAIVQAVRGEFVSLTDPPDHLRSEAAKCTNAGVWPVLAGDNTDRDCMFVSPIILSDYPRVAPESPGNLFDGAEIDELLTLSILTLTEEEKQEMREADERTRHILERAEALSSADMMQLHGVLRP